VSAPTSTPPSPETPVTQRLFSPDPEDRGNLVQIALIFATLVASVYFVGWVAWQTYGLAPGTPEALIDSVFDRWDVVNYELIARDGYGAAEHYAVWFPALPGLMRIGDWFGIPYWLTGTLIVIPCAAAMAWLFYHLVRIDFGPAISRDATVFLLVFPSAMFLFVPYTEAMFMLLAVASFYFARQRNWAAAAIAAGLSTGVRSTGMFLAPALLVEYLASVDWQPRRIQADVAWLALCPLGLFAYMGFLEWRLDDALAFYHQQDNVPHAETIAAQKGLIDFIPSLIDDVRVIYLTESGSERYTNIAGLVGISFFVASLGGMLYYRIRASYIVFSVLAVAASLPLGRLDSLNRYILYAFPMFIVLALLAERWPQARTPWLVLSLGLLYLSVVRFATGYWAG
jgi:hypothetical protein